MAVSLEEYRRRLVEAGLFSAEELRQFEQALPPDRRPGDAGDLAAELHRAGRLTRFQAAAVYQGKHRYLVLGEYEILERLGAGGMGQVFKARHRAMDRVVALKILPAERVRSPEAVERFRREVRAAARLTHPNIVIAYDAGEAKGVHFLVTEYVDGQDLARIVAEHGPMPVEEAVGCIIQAAQGLQYAHEHGVVHRDIKPGNLLLSREGVVKVLDLGLARLAQSAGVDAQTGERLTGSGQVMGTVDYMAPEQIQDTHAADHRADIYSLGCTLYRLLTGRPPYEGESHVQVLMGHLQQPVPSLQDARPEVPPALDLVFQKMVAKRPEDRPQSMREVIAALEQAVVREPVSAGGGESSTDQALQAFFVHLEQEQAEAKRVREETDASDVLQATQVRAGSADRSRPGSFTGSIAEKVKRRPWIWAGGVAVVVLLLGVLVVMWPKGAGKRTAQSEMQQQAARGVASQQASGTPAQSAECTLPTGQAGNLATLQIQWPQEERSDAQLEVDGKAIDLAKVVDEDDPNRLRLELQPGQHRLWIVRRGFVPVEQQVALSAGQQLAIRPEWMPAPEVNLQQPPADQAAQSPPEQPVEQAQPPATATAGQSPSASPDEQAMQPPAGQTEKPAATAAEDPQRTARRKLLAEYRQTEAAYRQAIGPVTEQLQDWQFD